MDYHEDNQDHQDHLALQWVPANLIRELRGITSSEFRCYANSGLIRSSRSRGPGKTRDVRLFNLPDLDGLIAEQAKSIQVNPGIILYGHNGRCLSEAECLTAFSIVIEQLTPLLASPEDFIQLVPGLSRKTTAFWSLLEILVNRLASSRAVTSRRWCSPPSMVQYMRIKPSSSSARCSSSCRLLR